MTQNQRILAELVRHHGEWVPMPQLASAADCYAVHSRIADLRGDGHDIRVRLEGSSPRRSFYRIVSPIQEPLALSATQAQP